MVIAGEEIADATGAVMSMVSVWVAVMGEALPAGSMALAETVLEPLVSTATVRLCCTDRCGVG